MHHQIESEREQQQKKNSFHVLEHALTVFAIVRIEMENALEKIGKSA